MKTINIFLASSNDMKKYREAAQKSIDEINQTLSAFYNITLKLFRWEKNSFPQMGRPQEIIFKQSDFSSIDIFIGILGSRFGTPTGGADENGVLYGSGTQEEYDTAYKLFLKTGKPYIMIFTNDAPLKPGTFDIEQYKKVQEFLSGFEANSTHPGIYGSFKSVSEFQTQLRVSLLNIVISQCKAEEEKKVSAIGMPEPLAAFGLRNIFLPQTNDLRSTIKKDAIKDSHIVYLISKTGNSFLGYVGNRYRDLLLHNAQQGYKIKVLLINPWSSGALMSAFGESLLRDEFITYLMHSQASQEVLASFVKTDWFDIKLKDVFVGYEHLQKEWPNIELRFIDTEIPASILITDNSCFFEPYANYFKSARLNKKVSTFEAQFDSTTDLYEASLDYFNTLWELSIPYAEFRKNELMYKKNLSNFLDTLYNKGTTFFIGVHAVIKKDGKFLVLQRSDEKDYMPSLWDIPGGSLEANETPQETLAREIKEETGISVKIGKLLYSYSNMVELPYRQTIQLIFSAEYISGDIELREAEHQQFKWVSFEEAKSLQTVNFLEAFLKEC